MRFVKELANYIKYMTLTIFMIFKKLNRIIKLTNLSIIRLYLLSQFFKFSNTASLRLKSTKLSRFGIHGMCFHKIKVAEIEQ